MLYPNFYADTYFLIYFCIQQHLVKDILKVEHLKKYFTKKEMFGSKSTTVRATDDVSFSLKKGEVLVLAGESGSGKSTIAKLILRSIQPDSGKIIFEDQEIDNEKKNLEEITINKNLSDQIKFYGPSYDEFEIYSLIAISDCCISPGEIGLTAIHALTYGTPVISHNNPNYQMPEFESIIDGVNGKLVEYNDMESLVEAVLNWFNENNDRDVVRNNCYKIIDEVFNPVNQKQIINNLIK